MDQPDSLAVTAGGSHGRTPQCAAAALCRRDPPGQPRPWVQNETQVASPCSAGLQGSPLGGKRPQTSGVLPSRPVNPPGNRSTQPANQPAI